MSRERPKQSWIRHDSESSPVMITTRTFNEVESGLFTPLNYFSGSQKILSVGEGLSSFADELADRNNELIVLAVDPIYSTGRNVLKMSEKDLGEMLEKQYGPHVRLDNWFIRSSSSEPAYRGKISGSRVMRLAGSTYDLPLQSNSVDKVVSCRMFEHIDFRLALPELLRVVKDTGEVRIAGIPMLFIIPQKKQLLTHVLEMEDMYEGYWHEYQGFKEGLLWMFENSSVSAYIYIDSYPRVKISQVRPDIRSAHTLIFRKDQNIPEIADTGSKRNRRPHSIMRITPHFVSNNKKWEEYFKLSRLNN